jgi:hypothetical protein
MAFSDYSRIMLAFDREPKPTERARANIGMGAQQKSWSNFQQSGRIFISLMHCSLKGSLI